MAFQSAFSGRLRDMESTRNQRLSHLEEEKLLQKHKSVLLSAKLAHIRSLEQRCLFLDHKLASQNFKMSSLKSEIEFLEQKFQSCAQQLRDLKAEVADLELLEEDREKYYGLKWSEMEEFKYAAEKFTSEIRSQTDELRHRRDNLNLAYMELKNSSRETENPDVKVAEIKKSELLATKENATCNLESNKRLRSELERQFRSLG